MSQADSQPEYWNDYSNLQRVKHELIREYLKGWFPKLTLGSTGCRRLLYIDTHAGRGKHQAGQFGSPLIALTTLIEHTSRSQMLQNTEIRYYFIEGNDGNATALRAELAGHRLPSNVSVEVETGECFQIIEEAVADMEKDGRQMAPAFIFVDPYGFKLPGKLLRKLLEYPKVELFVNVIWRELDMAIQQCRGVSIPPPSNTGPDLFGLEPDHDRQTALAQGRESGRSSLEVTLNRVFDGGDLRAIDASRADLRAEQCADLFRRMTGARWGTYLRMLDNHRVRYFLLHLTKHVAGRDLMKECMWKACPDGGFYASKSDRPEQAVLIQPAPDLLPLRKWVVERLSLGPKRWQSLDDEVREELWLSKHLNETIRSMRKAKEVVGDRYAGKFALTNNPMLRLASLPQT